jgi:hypothetical protein
MKYFTKYLAQVWKAATLVNVQRSCSEPHTMTPMTASRQRQPKRRRGRDGRKDPKQSISGVEQDTMGAMRSLRSALSKLIEAIPGASQIRKPADLQRALNVHAKLAWQVHKIATSTNPLSEVGNVPGPAAMARFLDAAITHGVRKSSVTAVQDALTAFEHTVKNHAGERHAFESIVSGLHEQGSEQIDLMHKRAAFKANSHLWGVQARTRLTTHILHPSAEPEMVDVALIRGVVGLKRLRRETPFILTRKKVTDNEGVILPSALTEPLDPHGAGGQGVSFMTEFCTQPLPRIRNVTDSEGWLRTEILTNGVGNAGAISAIVGEVDRRADTRYRREHNERMNFRIHVRTPFETVLADLIVRRGTYGETPIKPRALTYSGLYGTHPNIHHPNDEVLSPDEPVTYLGRGAAVLSTPAVPRYEEMVGFAFKRLGWDLEEFDVWRCRVEYPVMPSSVVVQFDLPEKPGSA